VGVPEPSRTDRRASVAVLSRWPDAIRSQTVLTFAPADLLTIALLVGLEALLSADNALVMAVMVLGLPKSQHKQALRYGLVGGFAFRIVATLLAVYLIKLIWVKLAGGAYLAYLAYSHFASREEAGDRRTPPKAKPMLGLSPFWATVVRVELINLAFSIDSILVAVAMSPKTWVVVSGGILGILAMRFVVGRLLVLVERYPALVDGAFVIIAWVAFKLAAEYANAAGFTDFEIPHWTSLIVIVVVLAAAYAWGRIKGPMPVTEEDDGARS
jgi:YkoY family integral membrane protein